MNVTAVEAATPVVPPHITAYVRENVTDARRWLTEAHGLLAQRPAIVPPREHLDRAIAAARNAAEHLYDIGQIDEPVEAVREAMAAAEAIMVVVDRISKPRPGIVDGRALAAEQLAHVNGTLVALERSLGLPHVELYAAH